MIDVPGFFSLSAGHLLGPAALRHMRSGHLEQAMTNPEDPWRDGKRGIVRGMIWTAIILLVAWWFW